MGGLGKIVPTIINPLAFGYDSKLEGYSYDPKKAKELLKQAGLANGADITIHAGVSEASFRQIAEAIAEMLSEVGLRTNLKIWEPGPAWNKFFQGEGKATHGFYGTWGYYSTFAADAILHPLYHTETGGWVGRWYTRVPGLDDLIDTGRSTLDKEKRLAAYTKVQSLIKDEAPSIFLFSQHDMLGINAASGHSGDVSSPAVSAHLAFGHAGDPGTGLRAYGTCERSQGYSFALFVDLTMG